MRVRALERGYYGIQRRKIGEEFDIRGPDELGKWMEPISDDADAASPKRRPGRGASQQDDSVL